MQLSLAHLRAGWRVAEHDVGVRAAEAEGGEAGGDRALDLQFGTSGGQTTILSQNFEAEISTRVILSSTYARIL